MMWTLICTAWASTAPVGLVGGAAFVAGPPSLGAGTVARLWIDLDVLGFEAAARETLLTDEPRMAGTIFVGLRRSLGRSFYFRGGFSHHHETPWDVLERNFGGAIAGTAPGIVHRSGAELGAGLIWPFIGTLVEDRAGVVGDASVGWMPDAHSPDLYAFVELDLVLYIGPASSTAKGDAVDATAQR